MPVPPEARLSSVGLLLLLLRVSLEMEAVKVLRLLRGGPRMERLA